MKNKQPLVSVIMNCYNSDTYLNEAIDSVIAQIYENWEIIFWDNQSTDDSAKIVNSYNDKRIKYFYAPTFTILGKARNLAIDKCRGEWIGFLDCDDLWNKEKLRILFLKLEQYENNQNVSLLYSKTIIINSENKTISNNNKIISGYIHNNLLIDGGFIMLSSIVIRKKVLLENEKINQNLNYCEDYDLLLKVTKNNKSIGIDKFLTSYRVHNGSITSTKMYENNIEEIMFLINYLDKNKLKFMIKLMIKRNITYKVTTFIVKLLLKKEFTKIAFVIKNYYHYLLFSPIIIPNILFNMIKR